MTVACQAKSTEEPNDLRFYDACARGQIEIVEQYLQDEPSEYWQETVIYIYIYNDKKDCCDKKDKANTNVIINSRVSQKNQIFSHQQLQMEKRVFTSLQYPEVLKLRSC